MVYLQRKLNNEPCLVNILKQSLTCIDLKKQRLHGRLDDYDTKKYLAKRKKLREDLSIGEKVFILAKRIKKKSAPGKFY